MGCVLLLGCVLLFVLRANATHCNTLQHKVLRVRGLRVDQKRVYREMVLAVASGGGGGGEGVG